MYGKAHRETVYSVRGKTELCIRRGVQAFWVKSAVKRWFTPLLRTALQDLCLHMAINLLLSPHLTGPGSFPKMHVQLFPKIDLTHWRGLWVHVHTYYGMVPPSLLGTQVVWLCMCRQGSLPQSHEWAPYLCFSRAQLLPLALSLKCLGENKAWILLTW